MYRYSNFLSVLWRLTSVGYFFEFEVGSEVIIVINDQNYQMDMLISNLRTVLYNQLIGHCSTWFQMA